ncbi:predicted protein [Nematostella vectensis]|uniref:Uncharacterized protein n=1 Tax=Nematostella vectensis TaxID=45351 RepID=A7RRH6_NEMVE|nr:predicted protein [Nematostella vectensis]|eukprot:XP_001638016.1 predicted protein [Nematostella vectensis]
MKVFLVLCVLVASSRGWSVRFGQDSEWVAWKSYHGKSYSDVHEERTRMAIWQQNLEKIKRHNAEDHSYKMAMNHLGDLTEDEFRYFYLGVRAHHNSTKRGWATYMPPSNVKIPSSVDWSQKGYVTGVKNQGQCGSCWAFSTTGSVEGQHFRKTGSLVSLSEQNLIDCSGSYGNNGCQGGLMDNAFRYIESNGGIDTESSYPYLGQQGSCHFSSSHVGARVTGYQDIPQGSEQALQSAVATVGPVSVAVDASQWQFYSSGVYDNPYCSSTQLDHGVLVIGYGNYNGQDYWLVKNSWGYSWGVEGYIMMSRNKNNQCGIASSASYPLV